MVSIRAMLSYITAEITGGKRTAGIILSQRTSRVAVKCVGRIGRFARPDRQDGSVADRLPDRGGIVSDSEVDYFGLAHILIDYHGADALAQADRLMKDALREADKEAATDWHIVAQAIALLTNNSGESVRH
jgi:hypothetical protein